MESNLKMTKIFTIVQLRMVQFVHHCSIEDGSICSLIRQDAAEEFISYVNRTNTSLSSQIQPSIFETNLFLMEKKPTLIEYAVFFGSIQIVQYLKYNNVLLTNSLWLFAVHSNNAEIIHFLEENEIRPEEDRNMRYNFYGCQQSITYERILEESILCHHNAIADYIRDNFLNSIQINCFGKCIINCFNYYYFPTDIGYIISNSEYKNGFSISQLCFSLTQITIPSSVTSIGNSAFRGCSSLTQITIPSSVNSIGDSAFSECSSLTQITFEISSSVTSIGNYAFRGCSSLTQITIPSSVTSIGSDAFRECSSLTQITIPSSVTSIGNFAFMKCSSLTQITFEISSSLTSIEYYDFYKCSIGDYAFSGCSSLAQITIPSSVTSIGNYAFDGCSSLTQVEFEIPSSVTSIGKFAFRGCSSLTQITIPLSVTSIGNHAFSKCSSLTQITIPSSLTSIGDYAFFEFKKIDQVNIIESNKNMIEYFENKFIVFKSNPAIKIYDTLLWARSTLSIITIPTFIKIIGNFAFSECSSLTQITIPSSVTSIGNGAFYGCSLLTQITIPSSVTSIGNGAFYGCSSLTQIIIPSSVTKIEHNTFRDCASLTKITMSSSVKSIGDTSFIGCKSLKEILFEDPASLTLIRSEIFNECPLLPNNYLPSIFIQRSNNSTFNYSAIISFFNDILDNF